MDNQIISIVIFLAGVALGATAGWRLLRTKANAASATDLATLKERLDGKEIEVQRLQGALNNEVAEHKHPGESGT